MLDCKLPILQLIDGIWFKYFIISYWEWLQIFSLFYYNDLIIIMCIQNYEGKMFAVLLLNFWFFRKKNIGLVACMNCSHGAMVSMKKKPKFFPTILNYRNCLLTWKYSLRSVQLQYTGIYIRTVQQLLELYQLVYLVDVELLGYFGYFCP